MEVNSIHDLEKRMKAVLTVTVEVDLRYPNVVALPLWLADGVVYFSE